MIDFLLALLGIGVALACLLPLLKTGGMLIACCMKRQHVAMAMAATAVQVGALFAGAVLAALMTQGRGDAGLRLLAVLILLACVYGADWWVRKTLLKNLLHDIQ